MDSDGPSFLSRALAIVVLVVVAAIALRLVVGFVAGILSFLLWVVTITALVVVGVWAWRTLKAPRRRRDRSVDRGGSHEVPPGTPADDRVAEEMRRIQQQLREQGRG